MDGGFRIGTDMDRSFENHKSGMDKYENLGKVGEGSYGLVFKCRNTQTGQLVAIKKFLESEEDKQVKKIAMREVKMLKMLHHDNLVNLLEVFKRKKKLYLVFEYVERTLLDELEENEYGLDMTRAKEFLWQIVSAVEFCHSKNVIHRDVKPENILVSRDRVVKLCDFGFARIVANAEHTDYVATRWYRAPELLVGDTSYGRPVDVWAIGCLYSEMMTAEPLYPGDSDIDQMNLIVKCLGNLTHAHTQVFLRNSLFVGIRLPQPSGSPPQPITLEAKLPNIPKRSMSFLKACLDLDPASRLTCSELLEHELFQEHSFNVSFPEDLRTRIRRSYRSHGDKDKSKRRTHGGGPSHKSKTSTLPPGATVIDGGLPKMDGSQSLKRDFQLPQLSNSTSETWGGSSKTFPAGNLKGMPSFPHMEKVAKPPLLPKQQSKTHQSQHPQGQKVHKGKPHHLPSKSQGHSKRGITGAGSKVDASPPWKSSWVIKRALPRDEGQVFAGDCYSNECSSVSEARRIVEANPEAVGFAYKPDDGWFFFKTGFVEAGMEWSRSDPKDDGNWEFHYIRERA